MNFMPHNPSVSCGLMNFGGRLLLIAFVKLGHPVGGYKDPWVAFNVRNGETLLTTPRDGMEEETSRELFQRWASSFENPPLVAASLFRDHLDASSKSSIARADAWVAAASLEGNLARNVAMDLLETNHRMTTEMVVDLARNITQMPAAHQA
jgi:hypothetical protein